MQSSWTNVNQMGPYYNIDGLVARYQYFRNLSQFRTPEFPELYHVNFNLTNTGVYSIYLRVKREFGYQ